MGTLEQLSYIHEIKQLKLEIAKLTEDITERERKPWAA